MVHLVTMGTIREIDVCLDEKYVCLGQAIFSKGPYPLGDFGVIDARSALILVPTTLWVLHLDWATCQPSPGDWDCPVTR